MKKSPERKVFQERNAERSRGARSNEMSESDRLVEEAEDEIEDKSKKLTTAVEKLVSADKIECGLYCVRD